MASIRIAESGLLTTVQDRGRLGYGHLGVPQGGAVDGYALRWAQRLAGLGEDAPALEITLFGPTLEVLDDTLAALAGADLGARVNGAPWPPGEGRRLRTGDVVAFRGPGPGLRSYMAFAGGIAADLVLGSRSTDLQSGVGGFGGRALRPGDVLQVGGGGGDLWRTRVPTMRGGECVRAMAGPRDGRFPAQALRVLTADAYRVTTQSDRVGMRLAGARVPEAQGTLLSEGIPLGGVEIPPSGQPIVLLQGRGTLGGYPVLATVIAADIPVLAQRRPGQTVRFALVDRAVARQAFAEQQALLSQDLEPF